MSAAEARAWAVIACNPTPAEYDAAWSVIEAIRAKDKHDREAAFMDTMRAMHRKANHEARVGMVLLAIRADAARQNRVIAVGGGSVWPPRVPA